jgi:transcription termination factor Rho
MLHSDIVYRRKMASMMAVGLTEAEAVAAPTLLSDEDREKMKAVVESRKQAAALQGGLGKRKRPLGRGTGRGRGGRRNDWGGRGNRDGGSRDGSSRDEGDGARDSNTDRSSKDSSENQSSSTPSKGQKKPFVKRGKGK